MKKHIIRMIIGCTVPLLLIFLASALGLGSGASLFIFILTMFACHLLMPMHYDGGHHHGQNQTNSENDKTENHAHHH